MRVKIKLTPTNQTLPIANQHLLNGYVHKCLGENNKYHDAKSDYSVSSLMGGKLDIATSRVHFTNGAYFTVTSLDTEMMNILILGLLNNTEFVSGLNFAGIDFIEEKFYDGWNHFATLSPFLIKRYADKKNYTFVTLDGENFQTEVKDYLIKKVSTINPKLNLTNFDVEVKNHSDHKIKKIMIKNVVNKANQCQISLFCNKQVAELLYNIGIGQSTGSGFGTIYKTENHLLYK